MKIASTIVFALALTMVLAWGGNLNIRESTDSSACRYTEAVDQAQLELRHYQITPNQTALFYLDNIAGYNNLDFYICSQTSGTQITTANLTPILSKGEQVITGSVVTSNIPTTTFKSMFYKMQIWNHVGATINITANILITK